MARRMTQDRGRPSAAAILSNVSMTSGGTGIEIGSEVNPDTVVCIIEAMKVMNEIKAEVKGIITQILVENAKPVEFGQPMFKIRPN